MTATHPSRAVEAVWRIESARVIAGLARMVGDVGLAEELAQDALVIALEQWPASGVPDNPGAWLMATAKHRAIDTLRRQTRYAQKLEVLARDPSLTREADEPDPDAALDDYIGDDLLRLIFTACHPVLSTQARVALALRLLGGLATDEIAQAFLVAEPTVAQRIVRAKRTLRSKGVAFEVPTPGRPARAAVVGAGGHLPHLQRGLLGHRGPGLDAAGAVRGGAPPRPGSWPACCPKSPRCTGWWR
jgi:RNA polymerase sigma factor (sigma-70 family)